MEWVLLATTQEMQGVCVGGDALDGFGVIKNILGRIHFL